MEQYDIKTTHHEQLADTTTPVSIYLKLRDKYTNASLLESSDYHSRENSYSYICCDPIASFVVKNGTIEMSFPDGTSSNISVDENNSVPALLEQFMNSFKVERGDHKFVQTGLFGYLSYDAVQYFEDLELKSTTPDYKEIPDIHYNLFRFVIVIDHFKNRLHVFRHDIDNQTNECSPMKELVALISNKRVPQYSFTALGNEQSNVTDDEYINMVSQGKQHCFRGDVFQIVLSREFRQEIRGDEFNVYRALRSINPSPYLFYFDYGGFRIFGSSPEAQLTIRDNVARINPIAGTYIRTGDDAEDAILAEKLKEDKKENAEHVMLVDLARNDLSRHADKVTVKTFRDIHYYSHVIHMVSEVVGKVEGKHASQIAADTFPAGTLSGAPKHMAMQLIDKYEPTSRSFYGGAIGFMGFHGEYNHAITIRSFLSKNNQLIYQSGAGVVSESVAETEMHEVNNKIAALRKAIQMAQEI